MEGSFLKSSNFLIDVGRDIANLIPCKKGGKKPYWYNCLELYSHHITTTYVNEYMDKNVPEALQFQQLKNDFRGYFEMFNEDFSNELISEDKSTGKKKFNDSWIAAESDEVEESSDSEDDETESKKKKTVYDFENTMRNRDIKITVSRRERGTNTFDVELPITEMYEAAKKIRKMGYKERHYPYAIVYGVYDCIMNSIENPPSIMRKISSELQPYVKKQGNDIEKSIKGAKKYIKPIMERNKDIMGGLLDQVLNGIDEIPDDQVDEISEKAQEHVSSLNKADGSLKSLLADFMPGSAEEVDRQMETRGLTYDNIRNMIDQHGSGAMSNEELLDSIPSLDTILGNK